MLYEAGDTKPVLCANLERWVLRREGGGWYKREGISAYLWLIHVDVWQNDHNIVKQLSSNKNK